MASPDFAILWAETVGDSGICIAVLDGPVDRSHPCFDGAQLTQLETLVADVADQGVASQHGTHVASVIFGQHGSSVRGIAPGCRGLIVPVFAEGANGSLAPCSQLDLARAITQAVEAGAHVINISGGELTPSGEPEALLAQAIRLCAERRVLIVAAAGNDGCQCLHLPAAVPSVLAVGAMDAQGSPMPFSNWGASYQAQGILAPGEGILGAIPGGGTAMRGGTSFATPIVSGVAGLLLSVQRARGAQIDPYAVRAALLESALPCDPQEVSDCRPYLVGRLNIAGAYRLITKGGIIGLTSQAFEDVRVQAAIGGSTTASNDLPATFSTEEAIMAPRLVVAATLASTAHIPTVVASIAPAACGQSTQAKESEVDVVAPLPMPPAETATAVGSTPLVAPSEVHPADCGCGCGGAKAKAGGDQPATTASSQPPALVYALGMIAYDFGMEARRDSFAQSMGGQRNPNDPAQLLAHLAEHPYEAGSLLWTLNLDTTPIYTINPGGPYAAFGYELLRQFLSAQLNEGVERVSVPGWVVGKRTLLSGQTVPIILPEIRGMYSWTTRALIKAILGEPPTEKNKLGEHEQKSQEILNFLERIYYEIRNLGLASQERAINYAATNAFQVEFVYRSAIEAGLKLDTIEVERSPVCRPGSDCWDVKLTFFHPSKRLEQARHIYRFTVDVSDVIPVTVGPVRHWDVY